MNAQLPIDIPSFLAVIAPVLDWYQSDEDHPRHPLDILADIVSDLQADRQTVLQLKAGSEHVCNTTTNNYQAQYHDGTNWITASPWQSASSVLDTLLLLSARGEKCRVVKADS